MNRKNYPKPLKMNLKIYLKKRCETNIIQEIFNYILYTDNIFNRYFHGMLDEGIYLPPSAFESYFLNDALSIEDVEFTISKFKLNINLEHESKFFYRINKTKYSS